jgi:PAS domain-containing protein
MSLCPALLSLVLLSSAASADPFILDDKFTVANLGPCIEYFEDGGKNLAISDMAGRRDAGIIWKKSGADSLGFGHSKSAFWARFTVFNKSGRDIEWYLQEEYPLLRHLDLYIPVKGGGYTVIGSGTAFEFSKRPVQHRTFVFPLKTGARVSETYYLRFEATSSAILRLNAYSQSDFQAMMNREMPMLWMLYGFLIVMTVYNLLTYLSIRDLSYLYNALYNAGFTLLSMSLHGTAYQYLWPDQPGWENNCKTFFIGLIIFSLLQFGRRFINLAAHSIRWDRIANYVSALCLVSGVLTLISGEDQFNLVFIISLAGVSTMISVPVIAYVAFAGKSRQAKFFFWAFALFFLGVLTYIGMSFGLLSENSLATYSMQAGAVAQAVLLSLGLGDNINIMRKNIEKTEKKYRNLIESSNDMIFSLDEKLNLLSVNTAATKHLGFSPGEITGWNFFDLIHETVIGGEDVSGSIVRENTDNLLATKKSVVFSAGFNTANSDEPVEMKVKLEYAESEGPDIIILGKASIMVEDAASRFLDYERHLYRTNNFIINAILLSDRLSQRPGRRLGQYELSELRFCLREMLINAIEHGNLDVKFDEKTRAISDGSYFTFIQLRQKAAGLRDRRVLVEYMYDGTEISYVIEDEGSGFDHRSYMKLSLDDINSTLPLHGRGILITRLLFDVIEYNEKGNRVRLVKFLEGNPRWKGRGEGL